MLFAFYLDNRKPNRWTRIAVDEALPAEPELKMGNGLSTPRPLDSNGDGTIDKTINADEQLVDATVANMINKFTLVGEELRYTLGSIKTAAALERGADKIKNAIKWLARANYPLNSTTQKPLVEASAALKAMIPLALKQLVDFHPDAANELLMRADEVQNAYRTLLMQHQSAEGEAPLLLVAKNLEQTADMAVEIMKTCYFVHTATKYEKSSDK